MNYLFVVVLAFFLTACDQKESSDVIPPQDAAMYFPPSNSDAWENTSPRELGWDASALEALLTYLKNNNTRAFIVLKDGKIVIEEYFGNTILNTAPFGKNAQWYWASAGKTLTATLVGIAQQDGVLNIDKPTSDYLGEGWTSLPPEKEQLITVKNQLTMTTGLDYNVEDQGCTLPSCLTYKTDAGKQWFYHNAPYTLLKDVITKATGTDYNNYTNEKIGAKIGMNGQWRSLGSNVVFWSTARDMARFGLLILNKGKWENTQVLSDTQYYKQMTNTSQAINPSYGYLWWLNGKSSIILPTFESAVDAALSTHAPQDLFAGMGKNGQFVEVIPSKQIVVVRMGEAPEGSQVPILFHDEMWEKINLVIPEE